MLAALGARSVMARRGVAIWPFAAGVVVALTMGAGIPVGCAAVAFWWSVAVEADALEAVGLGTISIAGGIASAGLEGAFAAFKTLAAFGTARTSLEWVLASFGGALPRETAFAAVETGTAGRSGVTFRAAGIGG